MSANEAETSGGQTLGRRSWRVLGVLAAVALLGIAATLASAPRNVPIRSTSVSVHASGIDQPAAPTGSAPFIDHSVVVPLPLYEEPDTTGASIAAYDP
jgi:hypothetical protein